jgi:nicotinic acid mononucleotide adenylyltransferase
VLPGISARTEFFEAPRMAVSSSDIRRRVDAGEPFGHLVLPEVAQIIEREGLYLGSAGMASPG